MSELVEKLRSEFQDEEYRNSYAEECVNTMIATQIKILREERNMTQSSLAQKAEMAQPRLSVMESADYSNWSVNTLKRLARAFDLALSVKFEAFSEVIMDFEEMSKESLSRPSFKDDPMFRSAKVKTHRAFRRRRYSESDEQTAKGLQMGLRFMGQLIELPHSNSKNNGDYSPTPRQEDSDAACIGIAG
jgi:transcriptional regulator with XRE-family HTH domain